MIDHNNKNFILAIVLSMAIIFGWQYFYAIPIAEQARQQATTAQPNATTTTTTTAQVPGSATAVAPVTRDQALAATPRLKIDTPELQGSINLTGAQLDDLHLTGYRETIDPKSPTIVLLSPAGTPNAFFAEQGFVGATGTIARLPDSKTSWQAPAGAVLGVGKPVTLTWDNGAGLVFTRQISIDDHFVFSVTQGVQNNSAAPVALIPYARVQRQDTPVIAGWWVFFEGMLGVLGDKLQEIHYRA
jgi:YidC/Oxa1 family membrane protein insertase